MSSVLGKRARTSSSAKQARPAKRFRTNQTSSTLNADKESDCPDKKPLPIATQGDTPKTPTKKASPSQPAAPLRRVFPLLTRVIRSKQQLLINYLSSQRPLQPHPQPQQRLMPGQELSFARALHRNVQAGRPSEIPSRYG